MSDVPPDRQCTLSTCEREATDPTDPAPVCETHLADVSGSEPAGDDEDDLGEPPSGDPEAYLDDPGFDGSVDAVREHYRRVRPVFEAFADLEGAPTAAFAGNSGWYRYRDENELELHELDDGHRVHRRAYTIERDFDDLLDGLEADPEDGSWRSFYNIASWKDQDVVYAGSYGGSFDDFGTGDGLAGYADMRGFGLWVDLDLEDNDNGADGPNYKKRRGALTDDERATVEAAYTAYLEEFADLYGIAPADVAAFDSGGGGYLYGPAGATIPIANRYDDVDPILTTEGADVRDADVRALIFKELRARMFAYATGTAVNSSAGDYGFEGIETRVNDRIDGADDLLSPDWMQNRNRQSKAPLAIHGDHDVVVTPLRDKTGTVDYTPTPVSAVDDELIERGAAEAAKIVDVPDDKADLEGLTEAFISALFPEYADRDDLVNWREILDAWVDDRRARGRDAVHQIALDERIQQERLEVRRDEIADRTGKDPGDVTPSDLLAGLEVTSVRKDVFDALEKRAIVDVRDVIRDHCADAWNTSSRDHETTFDPSWRGSSSGMSCAVPNGGNGFVDNGCDGGGGPAKAYALGNGILPRTDTAAATPLTGRKWGEAIDGLRSDGYDIPVYVPESGATNGDGEEYEQTPLWALRNAAVALDVCGPDDFQERETDDGDTFLGFDRDTYNATLEALDAEEIDHGREPLDGADADTVSALPLGQLDALEPQERRRYAKQRGLEWPTTDEARDRLAETIGDVLRNEDDRVVDAPTSLGKTHTVAATRWGARPELTGGRPVVHLLETRDARDEAIDVAEYEGGQYHVLLGRHEACPVAAGEYDDEITIDGTPASEWLDAVCDRKGLPFSTAHRYLEEYNEQTDTLPCCDEGECHAVKQWDTYREGPDGDLEYWPLVIATHNFAFAPGLRTANNIVIDEQPSYEQDLSTDRVRRAVGAYLREINAPVSTWEAFIQLARIDQYGTDASKERDALEDTIDDDPDREWYFTDPDAHILAPALARAIFRAEDRANGRRFGKTVHEPPRLEAGAREADDWNREWVSVVLDEANDVRSVRVVPDFGSARSVVGLDAHPATPLWQANTVPWIKPKEVLKPDPRQLWRRYERGLRVVQVGDATRPLSGDKALEWLSERKLRAIFDHLVDEYGTRFRTCITTAQVEDRVAELMDDAGVHRPDLMHFGEEKSRNDFAAEQIGLVNGCMDPGDDYVLDLLAELDLNAEAETATTDDGEEYRARGRGFDGPDAETATEILASVRENHTAQAAGRYARSPDDPEATATVFVRTDAVPDRFTDVVVPGVEWAFGEDQRAIVDELRKSTEGRTAREIADAVGCSKEHVRATLKQLSDDENGDPSVRLSPGEGENGATLYAGSGVPKSGVCDLGESPTDPYGNNSRWELAIRPPVERGDVDPSPEAPGSVAGSAWEWSIGGDSPPDTAG